MNASEQGGPQGRFDHVETWVFDLDNTLYPAHCNLFDQVDQRMGSFISQLLDVDFTEARRIQKSYFYEYGTTLRGLMSRHAIDPHDFLDFVHDIDVTVIDPDTALASALERMEGRKLVFTNGSQGHADNVLGRLGIRHHFDVVFDIADAAFIPKPEPDAYAMFVERAGFDAKRAAMFEDIPRNLETPHALGMTTVLVRSPQNASAAFINERHGVSDNPPYVHHVTDDLSGFLEGLLTAALEPNETTPRK
jgi:putative hydrolase of the HAD superfamily